MAKKEMRLYAKDLPWEDSRKWEKGIWYPLPVSHDIEYLGKEFSVQIHAWDLFRLDNAGVKGDIECLGVDLMFLDAVKLANKLNPKKVFTASWIKESWAQENWP